MSRIDGFLPDDWARCVMYSLSLLSSLGVVCVVSPVSDEGPGSKRLLRRVFELHPDYFFLLPSDLPHRRSRTGSAFLLRRQKVSERRDGLLHPLPSNSSLMYALVSPSYAKITRDLRRLDSVALSPLFSLWSEVISSGGMAVIRSCVSFSFQASSTWS